MSLSAGARLGPYEIVSALGAGGMGEVYRARDTRLDRSVAIKVLPETLSSDPGFRDRFDREARTISQLDHAHICRLYDVGHDAGIDFLVMEYLDGQTLSDRLAKGSLPLSDVLTIGRQIASALDQAHQSGIVHRDLKPGNIMLTKSGAKLLDFGLAKAVAPLAAGSGAAGGASMMPTAAGITAQGTILGTFQYMAPEQLEGHDADARSDLFAFGAVLYEMLTGRKAFDGKSHASLISAIMSADPVPLTTLAPVTPPLLDHIVRTCLAKEPSGRWQSAHDLARQLDWVASTTTASAPIAAPATRGGRGVSWWSAAATIGLLPLIIVLATRAWLPKVETASIRLSLVPPEGIEVPTFQLSPDGSRLAFGGVGQDGKRQIWIRALDSLEALPLKGTDMGVSPFWSPDGRSVGFFAQGVLKKIEVVGGSPQTICDAPGGADGTWGRDGTILFRPTWGHPIQRVSSAGGTPTPATAIDSAKEAAHVLPRFLPDGRHFLYFARSAQREVQGVYVASLDSTAGIRVVAADSGAVYAEPGYLVFAREGALIARPFDASTLKAGGEEETLASRVQFIESDNRAQFTVSTNGRLVYRTATQIRSNLTWVDRAGKEISRGPADTARGFAVSPDEKRVAVTREDSQTSAADVWLLDLTRGISSKFSASPTSDTAPVWSPDGTRIVFASDQGAAGYYNLFEKPSVGGAEQPLFKSDADKVPHDWSRDGRFILYRNSSKVTKQDLWVLSVDDRKTSPFAETAAAELDGQFSPDGRWIAYVSDESGQEEVHVQPFPPTGAKWQISIGGGTEPHWGRDARELFYAAKNHNLMSVTIAAQGTIEASAPHPLFELGTALGYAVSRDAQRFLVNVPVSIPDMSPLTVVLNWTSALKK